MPRLPEDRGALRALIAGGAVVVVIVILLVTGVLGGGDEGSGSGSGATTAATNGGGTGGGNGGKQPTEAILTAVGGGKAKGQALFGRSGQDVVLLLSAKGLGTAPKGKSYTVSLIRKSDERLPLVATKSQKGVISGRFQVAPQVLGLLASGFDRMEVSLVDDATLRVALAKARKAKVAPDYEGTPVLSGPVTGPIVEAGETG